MVIVPFIPLSMPCQAISLLPAKRSRSPWQIVNGLVSGRSNFTRCKWESVYGFARVGTAPPDPAAVNILLDPGLAFGTGTHPTTAMCLRAIDAYISHPIRVVDYGCGSGILGIAAARLGSGPVLAIDNDPQALVASRANAETNGVGADHFVVVMPDDSAVLKWAGTTDLVVANILAGPLVNLAPTLVSLLAPGGQLLLAGLLEDQASQVIDAYANQVPLEIAGREDGWVLLSGTARCLMTRQRSMHND